MSKTMRQAFAETMVAVGKKDPRLVVLIGDISHFLLQPFAKACPGRFYNIGICEQTIVSMAAGLAKVGLFPVVHTIAPFIIERSFEQLKDDFGYQRLGGNFVTVGSAFDYGHLGCTHHSYGDFALLKTIPRAQILYPAGQEEFTRLFAQTYANGLPTFFRLPVITHDVSLPPSQIRIGHGIMITRGKDLTIMALGPQLKNAIAAGRDLKRRGLEADILYLHSVRPLDTALIRKSVRKTGQCLVVEEHCAYGGVFDDVIRSCQDIDGVRYAGVNLGDTFIHQYGSYEELCSLRGLSAEGIVQAATELRRKR